MFRLEKVYHVYTRDIDETTNPYEAGLGWTVKLDKGDFIGRAHLQRSRKAARHVSSLATLLEIRQ